MITKAIKSHIKRYSKMKVNASLFRLPWRAQRPRPQPLMQLTSWKVARAPTLDPLLSDSTD